MRKMFLACVGMCLMSVPAFAQSLDINLNDYSVQVRYLYPVSEDDYGQTHLNARFLFNDDERTRLLSLGFDFVGEPGNVPGMDLGVGVHGYGGRTDEGQDVGVVGIGAQVRYAPPTLGGFGMGARALYAPKIFSFFDSERLLETAVRIGYAVTPKIRLHLEYQNIRVDFERRGTRIIDEGIRVGFEARF